MDIAGLSWTFMVKPTPASFKVSNLSINPTEVDIGKEVTVSIQAANTGQTSGTYTTTLKINGTVAETRTVTLAGGANQSIVFNTSGSTDGTYSVDIDNLSGAFKVKPAPALFKISNLSISLAEAVVGENVTISVLVDNRGQDSGTYAAKLNINGAVAETKNVTLAAGASQAVTFSLSGDTAGTYSISVGEVSGSFLINKAASAMTWWLIGGLVLAALAVIAGFIIFSRRRV